MSAFWMHGNGILAQTLTSEVKKALETANGNREVAAKLLGISERTMYRIVSRLELKGEEFTVCPTCDGRGRVILRSKRAARKR